VEELWRKASVAKMSFKPKVEERRSRPNGSWMVTVVMNEMTNWHVWHQIHDQQAGEVPWEADPEPGWCVMERAVVDLQRRRGRWAR